MTHLPLRWHREGMDRRFGRVDVDAAGKEIPSSGSVVVHDRMFVGKGYRVVCRTVPCAYGVRQGTGDAGNEERF
jgi:hypothetical protein